MRRLGEWFKNLSIGGKVLSIVIASVVSFGTINALAQPSNVTQGPAPTNSPLSVAEPESQPKTELITITEPIPFTSSTIDDATLLTDTTHVRVVGVEGERSRTFEVTYIDDLETKREEVESRITKQPVNEVVAKGTKAAEPTCPNGTYTNTYGNVVCRPYESTSTPAGATAQCEDGTYSFSQSRRGTCSGHGGVATWL